MTRALVAVGGALLPVGMMAAVLLGGPPLFRALPVLGHIIDGALVVLALGCGLGMCFGAAVETLRWYDERTGRR